MSELEICKYCGKPIMRGEVWNPDENGNGYHHACLIDIEFNENKKRVERLAQKSILDKIRAEIEALEYLNIEDGSDGYDKYIEQYEVLKIIDKYKAESETCPLKFTDRQ